MSPDVLLECPRTSFRDVLRVNVTERVWIFPCIERRDPNNAFSKHLQEHHPAREGDKMAFQFKVARTFRSSLMRQIWEAVKIHGSKATIVLNSKAEWMQPAIDRIVVTREPQDQQPMGRRRAVV